MTIFTTLTQTLNSYWDREDKGITFILSDQNEYYLSYKDLYEEALRTLYVLQMRGVKPGEELIFQVDDNLKFITLFWACLFGKIIPVPVTVGNSDEHDLKLLKIWKILHRPSIVLDRKRVKLLEKYCFLTKNETVFTEIMDRKILIEELQSTDQWGEVFESAPDDIAFIQFSSGSTGDPKGVVLTHENLMANVYGIMESANVTCDDSYLNWMPLTHDMGLIGMHLVPTVAGIQQYIMNTSLFIRRATLWLKKASEHQVSFIASPNFGYNYFLKRFKHEQADNWDLSCIRCIFNGAEPIDVDQVNQFMSELERYGLRKSSMFPCYGMAEASVGVSFPPPGEGMTSYQLDRSSLAIGNMVRETETNAVTFVDVGYPVRYCNVRICDENNQEVAENVVGHIQISGKNVTKGYYNNPEATNKVMKGDGWLQTGDIGFIRNGRLIIIGREKDIIFVMGQNVYPHDIERVAEELEEVEVGKVAVTGFKNHEKATEDIYIFVAFKGDLQQFLPIVKQLKKHVNKQTGLEVAGVFPINKIPKTTSGKLQRYKLREMLETGQFTDVEKRLNALLKEEQLEKQIDLPENEVQKKIHTIWKDVLNIEYIGIYDHFFELGGNSLKAGMVISQIAEELQVEITQRQFFENPTIADLSVVIANSTDHGQALLVQKAEEKEYYPITPAQKAIYVHHQMNPDDTSYNLSYAVWIEGDFNKERFKEACKQIAQRHDAFRTSIEHIDGQVVQRIHPYVEWGIQELKLSEIEVRDFIRTFVKPFALEIPPLARVYIIHISPHKHLLLFEMHHIVSDGTSIVNLAQEITAMYNEQVIPHCPLQHKDFAVWQDQLLKQGALATSEQYWSQLYSDPKPVLHLPTDFPRPEILSFAGNRLAFQLENKQTLALRQLALETNTTMYMVLLAVYNILLAKLSNQDDIVVGTPVSIRPGTKLDKAVGMFVNILPLRNKVYEDQTFVEFLTSHIKESCFKAYQHQIYPVEELIKRLNLVRDPSRNPLFDTMFVLQNIPIPKGSVDGLTLTPYPLEHSTSMFDLTFEAIDMEEQIHVNVEYSTQLFKADTVERFFNYYKHLIDLILSNKETKISEMELMTVEEKERINAQLNGLKRDFSVEFNF